MLTPKAFGADTDALQCLSRPVCPRLIKQKEKRLERNSSGRQFLEAELSPTGAFQFLLRNFLLQRILKRLL